MGIITGECVVCGIVVTQNTTVESRYEGIVCKSCYNNEVITTRTKCVECNGTHIIRYNHNSDFICVLCRLNKGWKYNPHRNDHKDRYKTAEAKDEFKENVWNKNLNVEVVYRNNRRSKGNVRFFFWRTCERIDGDDIMYYRIIKDSPQIDILNPEDLPI